MVGRIRRRRVGLLQGLEFLADTYHWPDAAPRSSPSHSLWACRSS